MATIEELQQLLQRQQAWNNGTYFATIDELFDHQPSSSKCNELTYRNLCRQQPLYNLKNGQPVVIHSRGAVPPADAAYQRIFHATTTAQNSYQAAITTTGQSRSCIYTSTGISSISTGFTRAIWKENVYGGGATSGQIAHLVPNGSTQNADTWFFVTDFLFGYDQNRTWDTQRRMIHGTTNNRAAEEGQHQMRQDHQTGVKHMVTNKVRLPGQATYFDTKPCVLIIPCLSVDEAKEWCGEGYDAIILIDIFGSDDVSTLASVAGETGFSCPSKVILEARMDDIQQSLDLLRAYLVGIVSSMNFKRQGCPVSLSENNYELPILQQKGAPPPPRKPVRKIHFSGYNSNDKGGGHPAPDPILLVVKAAVNWHRRHGMALAAVAARESYDEYSDELDELAERQYLEWRHQIRHPPRGPVGLEVTVVSPPIMDIMPSQSFTSSDGGDTTSTAAAAGAVAARASTDVDEEQPRASVTAVAAATKMEKQSSSMGMSSKPKDKSMMHTLVNICEIVAPPGRLGLVLDTMEGCGPVVYRVHIDSPMEGKIFKNDVIVAVSGVNTRSMNATHVTRLIHDTAKMERILRIEREEPMLKVSGEGRE